MGDGHDFTLGFDYFDNDTDTRIFSDYGVVSRGTTIDRRDAEDERTRTRWSLAYRYEGNMGFADSLQATVYQQSSESQQLTAEDRTSPAGAQQKRHRFSSFDQDINGAFIQFTKSLEFAGVNHVISYGADYYRTDSKGLDFIESFAIAAEFLGTGGTDPADGLLTFQSINRANVDINGAELSGVLDLGALNEGLDGLSLRLAVAYADGKDRDTGEAINSIEPLTGILGLGYMSANDRWGAELIWTGVESKDESEIDANNPRLPTAGYGIVDLLAHVSLSERVRLNVGLFNLGDKTYIHWSDTQGIGGDAPARFTQPGFNAGATLRIDLW